MGWGGMCHSALCPLGRPLKSAVALRSVHVRVNVLVLHFAACALTYRLVRTQVLVCCLQKRVGCLRTTLLEFSALSDSGPAQKSFVLRPQQLHLTDVATVLFPGNADLYMWLHRVQEWCTSRTEGPMPSQDAVCWSEAGKGAASSAIPGTQFLDAVLALSFQVPSTDGSGIEDLVLLPPSVVSTYNIVRLNAVAAMSDLAARLRPVCLEAGMYETVPRVADIVEVQLAVALWLVRAAAVVCEGLQETLAHERVIKVGGLCTFDSALASPILGRCSFTVSVFCEQVLRPAGPEGPSLAQSRGDLAQARQSLQAAQGIHGAAVRAKHEADRHKVCRWQGSAPPPPTRHGCFRVCCTEAWCPCGSAA
jgi:hypothetical protein